MPQTRIIKGLNHSMLIQEGLDLDVENMWQVPEIALIFSDLPLTALWRNDVHQSSPLFLYLVVWSLKDYIPSITQWVWRDQVHRKDVFILKFLFNDISYMTQESKAKKLRPAGSNKDPMGVLGDFPLSHEPIPSLEGIEEKLEHSEELCNFNPPKLESLELGEEFKFDDFLFLKYPEEFISEKHRGIHESITETELKCDVACVSALSGPKAIELELPIIQCGAGNIDFSQSKDNSGDLFIFPFISMLEPIGECNMASHVSHEVTFDQLQQGVHDSDCEENNLYTT